MTTILIQCSICQKEATDAGSSPYAKRVSCPRCGRYRISTSLDETWRNMRARNDGKLDPQYEARLPSLAALIRQSPEEIEFGFHAPWWYDLADAFPVKPVTEKARLLLETIAGRSSAPGMAVPIDEDELGPLVGATGPREIGFLLRHLFDGGYLENTGIHKGEDASGSPLHITAAIMTVAGWEFVQPRSGAGVPGTCFVAMWFNPELDDAFERGLLAAVELDCGLRAIRMDREHHTEEITYRMLADIRRAQCLVADLTGHRQSVYFEVGFAHALGRPFILTCRETHFEERHFDLRQFPCIKWVAAADLRQQLTERIRGLGLARKPE